MSLKDAVRKALHDLKRYEGEPLDAWTLETLEEVVVEKLVAAACLGFNVNSVKVIPDFENRRGIEVIMNLEFKEV